MYTHVLTQGHHFIEDGAEDPIQKTKLTPGDCIVVCAHCYSPFLISSWQLVNSKDRLLHGGIDNTLQNINNGPTSGNLKFGKTKSSYPPIQPPPISRPTYTSPPSPRETRRPLVPRVEQRRSYAGRMVWAFLLLVVISVLVWQQYKKDKQLKLPPTSQAQSSENTTSKRKAQRPKPTPRSTTGSSVTRTENSGPGNTGANLETTEQTSQDRAGSFVIQRENSGQGDTVDMEKIEFTISSNPDGALIYLDEKLFGVTPFTLKAPPGKYKLRIVKDGYPPIESTIRVSPTSKNKFSFSWSAER